MGVFLSLQPAWALSVNPGRTEISLKPGAKSRMMLTVTNEDKEDVQVQVSSKDWFVLPANKGLSSDQWIKIHGKELFILKPGENRKVSLTILCPKQAQGELVGMVSFTYQTRESSMVTPMISVSMYVEAAGTEQISGEITELSVLRWKGKVQAAVAIKSTGNVHLRPTGHILLNDASGKTVADYIVPEENPTYPGRTQGYFGQGADAALQPGHYQASANLMYRMVPFKADRGFTVAQDGNITMDDLKKQGS